MTRRTGHPRIKGDYHAHHGGGCILIINLNSPVLQGSLKKGTRLVNLDGHIVA